MILHHMILTFSFKHFHNFQDFIFAQQNKYPPHPAHRCKLNTNYKLRVILGFLLTAIDKMASNLYIVPADSRHCSSGAEQTAHNR